MKSVKKIINAKMIGDISISPKETKKKSNTVIIKTKNHISHSLLKEWEIQIKL